MATNLFCLLHTYTWPEICPVFLRLYPEWAESLSGHEQVFRTLKALSPQPSDMRIVLTEREDDGERYTDVSGQNGALKRESAPQRYTDRPDGEEEESFGLDFTDWEAWLGMAIDEETLRRYPGEEVVVHCLWEMTFYGYTPEAIRAQREELLQEVEAIRRGEVETIPWEEVEQKLKLEE